MKLTKSTIKWGGVAIAGLVILVVGASVPAIFSGMLKGQIRSNAVLQPDTQAFDDWRATPKRGLQYGGSDANDKDQGITYNIYVSNITNVEAVLFEGAAPVVEDVQYRLRKYTKYEQASFSDGDGVLTFKPRNEYLYLDDDAKLDGDVLTIPNAGYFNAGSMLTMFAQMYQMYGIPSPTVDYGMMTTFEDGMTPLLVASFFHMAMGDLVQGMRMHLTSPHIGGRMQADLGATMGAGGSMADWAAKMVDGDFTAGDRDAYLMMPEMPGFPASMRMTPDTVLALWDPAATRGFEFLTQTGFMSWFGVMNAIAENGNDLPVDNELVTMFATQYAAVDARYSDATTGAELAKTHLMQGAGMLGGFINTTLADTPGTAAIELTEFILGALEARGIDFGAHRNMDGIVAAQFGSNALYSFLADLSDNNLMDGSVPASTGSPDMANDENLCDNMHSMDVVMAMPEVLPTHMELSCTTSRDYDASDMRLGGNSLPEYTGTKLTVDQMAEIIAAVSTGDALFAELASTGMVPDGIPAGSKAGRTIMAIAGHALSTSSTLAADRTNLHQLWQAVISDSPPANAYADWYAAYNSGYEDDTDLCSQLLSDNGLPDMTCFQLLDVADWMTHLARALVWEPQVVQSYPGETSTAANQAGIAAGNLATGPFIRVTPRQLLATGIPEPVLDMLGQGGIPNFVPDASDRDAWLASNPPSDSLFTGEGSDDETFVIKSFRGQETRGDWTGPSDALRVAGSYDGFRYEPAYELGVEEEDVHGQLQMWFGDGVRTLRMTRGDTVEGPNGHIEKLYRYEFQSAETANERVGINLPPFDRYAADDVATAPGCMMTMRQHPEFTMANMMTPHEMNRLMMFDIYATVPHLGMCPPEVHQESATGMSFDPAVHGSYVDLEPTSGFALNGAKRLGFFVRYGPSPYYPRLAETAPNSKYYTPWMWAEETGSASDAQESELAGGYAMVATGSVVAPIVGVLLGLALMAWGGLKVYKIQKTAGYSLQAHGSVTKVQPAANVHPEGYVEQVTPTGSSASTGADVSSAHASSGGSVDGTVV